MVTHRVKLTIMKTLLLKIGLIGGIMLGFASFSANSQAYNLGYPNVTNLSTTSGIAEVNATVGGRGGYYTSFVVLPSSDPVPTIQNVIDWTWDGDGGRIPSGQYADIYLASANSTFTSNITGLSPNSSYVAYFVTHQNWTTSIIETDTPTSIPFSTPPSLSISTLNPGDEATGVSLNGDLIINFSDNISRGSGNLTIYNSGGDFQTIPASSTTYLSLSDNQLTITHNTFSESTDYYVLMDNGFISGFSGISDPDTWNFTTSAGAPVWTTTPSLSNQSPSEVTLSGRADQNGTFYFAILNSIDPAPSKEDIKSGATATIHGSGTLTANQPFSQTIDITSLTAGNVYTLYIIADNGSSYSDPVVSRNIDLVAPDLNSVNPSNGTTDVDINATITLTYSKPIFGTGGVILDNSNIGDYIKLQTGTVPTDVPFTIEFNNTGNILTLTPDAYLDDNTAYTLNFVTELEDQNGNVQSELSTNRTFTTENVIFWMGGTTDWNTNTNWEDNTLPDDHSILIPAGLTDYPEINSGSASLNNVYIEAGASLTNTGASINVSGQFVLQSSDVANAAYVPQGGTLTVTDLSKVRIEQIISDPTDVYYISAPVSGATKGNTGITDAVVYYDNTTDAYIYLNNDADALEHGRGYVVRNPGDIAFTGSIFQEDLSTEVIRTAGQGLGWNLIGNPYTASIDLNLLTLNNVDNTFWIYRNDPGLYGTYNTTGVSVNLDPENPEILPSNTSFWVRVNKDFTSGTVGFTRTNTRGNPHTYLKSTSSGFQYPLLKLATNFNGIKDETALVQIPEASTGYDNYDSDKKLSGKSHICDFYSTAGTSKLAINSVPSLEEGVSINLGFVQNTAIMENCEIAMVNNTLPSNISVLLEDKVENTMTDITNGTPYSFSSDKRGKTENRFVIHFAGSVATNTTEAEVSKNNEKIQIFTNKSEIIAYLGQLNKPEFQLFDINGRLLKNGTLNAGSRNVISVNHNGSIVLVITHSEGIKTFKTVF